MSEASQFERLVEVMRTLRTGCPWDAEQTHLSLVTYLVEETLEVVDAIETGDDESLLEELGDLLLQVVFHAQIASETGRFDIEDVSAHIADKLIARHPYVYAGSEMPADLMESWEQRKVREKGRTSVLDGIPARMSALSRAAKVLGRAGRLGHSLEELGVEPAGVPPEQIGTELVRLAAEAQAAGLDPEQEARTALREIEKRL